MKYVEKEVNISEIEDMLLSGIDFKIDTPDGWQEVDRYINKGKKDIFHAECDGIITKSAGKHLYETVDGWKYAKDMVNGKHECLTKNGFMDVKVTDAGYQEEVVDITINHENHRYFTNNVCSHNTGVGKTIFMCHCAASTITQGKNVLYITLEMSEEKIAERIDANLMDIELDDFEKMDKPTFLSKFKKVAAGQGFLSKLFGIKKKKKLGRLFVKEFPTGAGNANHFRFLLDELELKKEFIPDFIIIDYINICSSTRLLPMAGSYTYIKSIAEELRGMAVEYNVPILTGTQTNRGGFSNSDIEMTDTSESIGLPATLDLYIALMSNDELAKSGRIAVKQLKNRYRDESNNKYITLGIDKPKMRFFNVEDWDKNLSGDPSQNLVPADEDCFTNDVTRNIVKKTDRFDGINI